MVRLDSNGKQIEKILNKRVNIDIGTKKRICIMSDNKGAKAKAKQALLDERNAVAETAFQLERAKRITELVQQRQERQMQLQQNNGRI